MRLPDPVRRAVEEALGESTGRRTAITGVAGVGGGCVSPVARVETDAGDSYFLKLDAPDLPAGLLAAESRGLRLLGEAGAVRVPRVAAVSDGPEPEWLLLEWLEPGPARAGSWERLGRELAELHRVRGPAFGEETDNFIGPLPQRNAPADSWAVFWRDRRLEPQLRRAVDGGHLAEAGPRFTELFRRLDELLASAEEDGPSRLHGDLWSGNVHMMADGTPAVVDPSVYHGHREVDLAMAELFGGFGVGFMAAYDEAWPLLPGYAPTRRAVYQLYYLLVHVNLFGGGYVGGTLRALGDAGC